MKAAKKIVNNLINENIFQMCWSEDEGVICL